LNDSKEGWVLGENDFLAFLYAVLELRNNGEFRKAKSLIDAMNKLAAWGGPATEENRYIFSFFEAQISESLSEKGHALYAAHKCRMELAQLGASPGGVFGVKLVESVRTATDAIISRHETRQPFKNSLPKVGRNALCPCGSGKKYKHCHGR